ncbi:MAG: hypothetical protein D6788_00445 [Planctomycetota bacterium]|nr:MAG: hypothetical protein D6788_00445 [Planctomycetota bacterium]
MPESTDRSPGVMVSDENPACVAAGSGAQTPEDRPGDHEDRRRPVVETGTAERTSGLGVSGAGRPRIRRGHGYGTVPAAKPGASV